MSMLRGIVSMLDYHLDETLFFTQFHLSFRRVVFCRLPISLILVLILRHAVSTWRRRRQI
jgi:hypothetical protein